MKLSEREKKMKFTQNTKEIIIHLMRKSEWNRNSDFALYADYISYCHPEICKTQYYEVMQNHEKYKIASFKSIERLRRQIQREAKENGDISLLSNKTIERRRKELEQEYREEYKKMLTIQNRKNYKMHGSG